MLANTVESIPPTVFIILRATAILSFIWLPLVFAGFAFGRKQIGLRFLFALMTAEAIAIALGMYLEPAIFGQS